MSNDARALCRVPVRIAVAALSLAACSWSTADPGERPAASLPASSQNSSSPTAASSLAPGGSSALVGDYAVKIVATYPHDPEAYTQGLELHDGLLLESTGRFGRSSRRWVLPESGEIVDAEPLDDEEFGEGITMVDERIFQLTWTNNRAIIADGATLDDQSQVTYEGEGWGICHDGASLIMSNGSAELTVRDPETFAVRSTVLVMDNGVPVDRLNELECRAGQVLANIYGSDEIVVIDPQTGAVAATIDARSLRPLDLAIDDLDFALNGIAHDPGADTLYLTGKLWPVLYEVRLVAR